MSALNCSSTAVTRAMATIASPTTAAAGTAHTSLRSMAAGLSSIVVRSIERSDVCAVPAAAVVGEAMVSFILADAFLEKFGGDSIDEIERHYAATADAVRRRFA